MEKGKVKWGGGKVMKGRAVDVCCEIDTLCSH